MNTIVPLGADDLRAELARHGVYGYRVGARVRINPIRFSRIMRGRERLTPELAARIMDAIRKEAEEVAR